MAFVYPLVLQSDRFGADSASIVVMWEFPSALHTQLEFFIVFMNFCILAFLYLLIVGEPQHGALQGVTELVGEFSEHNAMSM